MSKEKTNNKNDEMDYYERGFEEGARQEREKIMQMIAEKTQVPVIDGDRCLSCGAFLIETGCFCRSVDGVELIKEINERDKKENRIRNQEEK